MQSIFVRDYILPVYVGIYPQEKQTKQRVRIEISVTLHSTSQTYIFSADHLEHSISYENLIDIPKNLASDKHYETLEFYAEEIAAKILKLPHAVQAEVTLEKLDIFANVPAIPGVRIVRRK